MMVLSVKLGTHPMSKMQVLRKRQPPIAGERVSLRDIDYKRGGIASPRSPVIRARCLEVRDMKGYQLYFMERL